MVRMKPAVRALLTIPLALGSMACGAAEESHRNAPKDESEPNTDGTEGASGVPKLQDTPACAEAPEGALAWSDIKTWTQLGASKPSHGDLVTIPGGFHIVMDESPPALAGLIVEGTLQLNCKDIDIQAGLHRGAR